MNVQIEKEEERGMGKLRKKIFNFLPVFLFLLCFS